MNAFQVLEPETVEEAVHLLGDSEEVVRPIAGGTALMLMLRSGVFQPDTLVSLQRVDGLTGIRQDGDELQIGAMTSLSALERSAKVRSFFPVISRTLSILSTVQVRNLATIGGHLAHGDPHRDLPPVLLTLDARVEVTGLGGPRWMPLEELFIGYYKTSLAPDELLTCIAIPVPPTDSAAAYHKHTAFTSKDWPAVGVAAYITRSDGRLSAVRIAVGAATEMPVRLASVEKALINQTFTDGLIDEAAALAAEEIDPLADLRGSAAYKREMVRVHIRRALISVRSSLNLGDA
jgi:carbon-monoxide dehydrogenase medium subunit